MNVMNVWAVGRFVGIATLGALTYHGARDAYENCVINLRSPYAGFRHMV
jgi:hypothetical protein